MTLCLPFLMFQGQAQEALDHYLETFPDAELLEIHHHPGSTEIFDPTPEAEGDDSAQEDEGTPEERPEDDAEQENRPGQNASDGEAAAEEKREEPATEKPVSAPLVATAQLKIGGQVLMVQDSLIRHEFDFTPSVSIAIVVDTSADFDGIVEKLAEDGTFLMEPGDYDFAKNFAWITDRFGVSWQVNHPLGAPDGDVTQAKAPEWS